MSAPYKHPESGTVGTADFIDDVDNVHMKWTCGSGLALIPEVDKFEVIHRSVETVLKNSITVLKSGADLDSVAVTVAFGELARERSDMLTEQ